MSLKAGTMLKMRNGDFATLLSNERGNARRVSIQGNEYHILTHNIEYANIDSEWLKIEHNNTETRLRAYPYPLAI